MITIENFIKACASGAFDPKFVVTKPQDWMQILNFQGAELYPDIGYRGLTNVLTTNIGPGNQIDLSNETEIEDVKEVFLIDSNGKEIAYDNWIFHIETKQLDINPDITVGVTTNEWRGFVTIRIIWYGFFPAFTKFTEIIVLPRPQIILLQKICVKESLRRVLLDHTKLDRFRTLVSRINEYALLAIIRDYTTEIELSKRRLVDVNQIRTY